jgi:hypothetical protein
MQIMPVAAAPALPPDKEETLSGAQAAVRQISARLLNPQPVIDPALGIVVTEYFNQAGAMTEQYPTAKAVETYRIYGLHRSQDAAAPDGSNGKGAARA